MLGSFLTRGLVMVCGYAYPAYECYKTVEMNKPSIEQLRFWCQYWILVAVLTVCERVGDAFISWVPMYSEAKLAFFLYLWCPKTKGTTYVYDCFFKPVISNHEAEIDRNLLELRTRAEDLAVLYWQKSASYVQTRVFDILQYIASQSSPPRAAQPQQQAATANQPPGPPNRIPTVTKKQTDQPPSPASTSSSSQDQEDSEEEVGRSQPPVEEGPAPTSSAQKAIAVKAAVQTTKTLKADEGEAMQIDSVPSSADENAKLPLPPPETTKEETFRVTRNRSRKTHTISNR